MDPTNEHACVHAGVCVCIYVCMCLGKQGMLLASGIALSLPRMLQPFQRPFSGISGRIPEIPGGMNEGEGEEVWKREGPRIL